MRSSSEHKAEAERLLHLARTDEGRRADDPTDPVLALQVAQTHALLAAAPDYLVEAMVVDEDAWPPEYGDLLEWLKAQLEESQTPHDLALHLLDRWPAPPPATPSSTDEELAEILAARTYWHREAWVGVLFAARTTAEALVVPKIRLQELRDVLVEAQKHTGVPGGAKAAIVRALSTVNGYIAEIER